MARCGRASAIIFIAWLASCYHPSFRDCAIRCESSSACPSGLSCDMAAHMCTSGASCSGGADASLDPNGDADNDGIANGSDNCPTVANPDQADEDGDHIGDACDACPIAAGDTDSDGDGLPDPCDPHPTPSAGMTIHDHITLFDGFSHGLAANAVGHGSAPPAAAGGLAIIDAVSHEGYLAYAVTPGGRSVTVMTNVHYSTPPDPLAGGGPLTDVTSYDANDRAAGFGCEIESTTVASYHSELDVFETDNQSNSGSLPLTSSAYPDAQPLWITNRPASSTVRCTHDLDQVSGSAVVPATQYEVGLYAHGVRASFDYVLVIDSDP